MNYSQYFIHRKRKALLSAKERKNLNEIIKYVDNDLEKGFFKTGDCIEISGEISGIVTKSNKKIFWLSRLHKNGEGVLIRIPDEAAYSNEPSHYEDSYWIKKIEAPKEYKYCRVTPLKI